jgi:hypothetical protein
MDPLTHPLSNLFLAIADILANALPPPLMISLVFIAAYLMIGIPAQFRSGSVARNIHGTIAGLCAGLAYLTFILGIYPDLHDRAYTPQIHAQSGGHPQAAH